MTSVDSRWAAFRSLAGNAEVLRLLVAYSVFAVSEYATWVALLVYAYHQGGATTAGVVAVSQLLPAVGVALLVSRVADRSPVSVLGWGYAAQALGAGAAAALLLYDAPPLLVYAAAGVLNAAIPTTRPAQSALTPAVTTEVNQLTACNVAIGWVDSGSILVAGALAGVVLTVGSPGEVFASTAVLLTSAALVVVPLRRLSPAVGRADRGRAQGTDATDTSDANDTTTSLAALWRDGPARTLVGLLGAEYVVVGAIDLLLVVLAVDLLDAGNQWVGYLNTADGVGAVLLGVLGVLLVGKRLALVIFSTAALLGLALAVTALGGLTAVVLLVVLVGGARALFEMSVRVLLQRSVRPERLAHVFGVAEGLNMLALGVGSVLVPVLVAIGGARLAVLGTAVVLPAVVIGCSRVLVHIDDHARVPVVEIALLRQLPLFSVLPGDTLEGLALSLERVHLDQGAVLMREGQPGDYYYAVADGTVEVSQRGHHIRSISRPGGLGEIALLRSVPRTATAVASTPVTAYRLSREAFLTAVSGHSPTLASADALVRQHQSRDADRWGHP